MRGKTADIVALDEAAFISEKAFVEYISPIVAPRYASLIAISSPVSDPTNWFMRAVNSGVYRTISVELVCARCKARGEIETCRHKLGEIPPHTSAERLAWIAKAVGAENAARINREMRGIVDTRGPTIFPADRVMQLVSSPRARIDQSVRRIITVVDPCNGSNRSAQTSDYALVSIAVQRERVLIVGVDLIPVTKNVDYLALVAAHFRRLRASPLMQEARLVVAVENLTGLEHAHVYKLLTGNFTNVQFVNEEHSYKHGFATTNEMKRNMAEVTERMLSNDLIAVADGVCSADVDRVLAELRDQMLRFSAFVKEAESPHQKTQVAYSGKGLNNKLRDDAAVALQLAVYWMLRINTDPAYARLR